MPHQKTVLITGCSAGGIGSALAKEFHFQGCRVFATSRRLESMDDLVVLGIEALALDVTDLDAIRKTRAEISTRTGGKLDILVNNAGQAFPGAVTDMDMSAVRALYEINVFAPMCMVQEFAPLLISSGKGCIINVGSILGVLPVPFSAGYNTSKAALHAFGNTLAVELAPFNISVVNVITGGVKSNVHKPYSTPDGSLYKAMELNFDERIERSNAIDMPTNKYAQIVVAEATKAKPRTRIWVGTEAWMCWLMETFFAVGVIHWLMKRVWGLPAFSAKVRNGKDKGV
ncbi:NAD-P-binding protein [Mycena crocata]|nr:NAD-P-binding protein [Mycena crocata]